MKRVILFLCVSVSAILNLSAQQTLTVADGTDQHEWFPFASHYWSVVDSRSQVIYPAEMLTSMVGSDITAMKFYVYRDGGMYMSGGKSRISMGTTTINGYYNSFVEDLTPVAVDVPGPQRGTFEIEVVFDEPFTYAGGNLVYEWVLTEAGDYTTYITSFCGKRVTQSVAAFLPGGGNINDLNIQKFIPKTTFTYGRVFVTTKSLDFGTLLPNTEKTLTVKVKNIESSPITPSISGLDGAFSSSYTPTAIAAGATVEIPVTYKPTKVGSSTGKLTIKCGTETYDVSLTGNATKSIELTVCDGNDKTYNMPFHGGFISEKNSYSQMIYPEDKLADAKGHKITSIKFYPVDPLQWNKPNLELSLGQTSQAEFGTPVGNLKAVCTASPANGATELEFKFDEPFEYTGDNFVVQLKVTKAGSGNSVYFYGENQDTNTGYILMQLFGTGLTDSEVAQFLPKMSLVVCDDTSPEGYEMVTITDYTPYSFSIPSNTLLNGGPEGYAKLVDNDKTTKWCVVSMPSVWYTSSVSFKSSKPFIPKSYVLTTGNDTQEFYGRNPKEWTIYAKQHENDDWTVLTHVTDGAAAGLGTANTTDYTFDISSNNATYQYFCFEVNQVGPKSSSDQRYVMQLAELQFSGLIKELACDVNNDGYVNVTDVNLLVSAALSGTWPDGYDLNDDNTVNVTDINLCVSAVLNQK